MKTSAYKNSAGPLRAGLALLSILLLCACGITAPRSNDGYADLDSLGVFDTDRTMSLSFGPTVLRFAAMVIDEDEPETAAMLRDLEGVRVRIYEIDGDPDRVAGRIKGMSDQLQGDNWEPVMLVQDESEQTHMLLRSAGEQIQGLTLLTADDEEAVVINLMGNMNPHLFSDVMVALDVDAPDVQVASLE